jgi:dethiobiotin synthetase
VARIIFVTGTDTGVGKTVITALLLHQFRRHGVAALAMKPFCSGSRHDVDCLQSIQEGELTVDECNPFYFQRPLAPWVAARLERRSVSLKALSGAMTHVQRQCAVLLVEGAGGVLAPLGRGGFTMLEVIQSYRIPAEVVVVARNSLGTINHTLLAIRAVQSVHVKSMSVILNERKRTDESSLSNLQALRCLLGSIRVRGMPYLGLQPLVREALNRNQKNIKKSLAPILG